MLFSRSAVSRRGAASCARLLILFLTFTPASALAQAYIPNDDAVVLERVPVREGGVPILASLRRMRAGLAADPENLAVALELAKRQIEFGRTESDPRYYGYAEAALAPWWDAPDPPAQVLLFRATVRQNRHDFQGALEDLDKVLKRDPRNGQAWLTRAVVHEVRGELALAGRSCERLLRLTGGFVAAVCLSSVASLGGSAEGAYALLARELGRPGNVDTATRQWAMSLLGEIAARSGRPKDADRIFSTAVSLDPRDVFTRSSYADFLLDENRPADVVALIGDDTRADPLLLRLAMAEKRLSAPQLGVHVQALRARFAAVRARGAITHIGEEGRFNLHVLQRPEEALRLAEANWAVQRQPKDARLLLEAALAAGDRKAAGPALAWLESTGIEDVRLRALATELEGAGP